MQAGINVANEFFAGVELRIGEETMSHQEDKSKVSFRLIKEEARPRNLWVKGPGFSDGYWGG